MRSGRKRSFSLSLCQYPEKDPIHPFPFAPACINATDMSSLSVSFFTPPFVPFCSQQEIKDMTMMMMMMLVWVNNVSSQLLCCNRRLGCIQSKNCLLNGTHKKVLEFQACSPLSLRALFSFTRTTTIAPKLSSICLNVA
jgi:hypothetical protein